MGAPCSAPCEAMAPGPLCTGATGARGGAPRCGRAGIRLWGDALRTRPSAEPCAPPRREPGPHRGVVAECSRPALLISAVSDQRHPRAAIHDAGHVESSDLRTFCQPCTHRAAGLARPYLPRHLPLRQSETRVVRFGFRARLLLILSLFAVAPALAVAAVAVATFNGVIPLLGGAAGWERVAGSGARAMAAARERPLTDAQRAAIEAHESALRESVASARQLRFVSRNATPIVIVFAGGALLLLGFVTSRVAGHLSRQLSRPLDELVGWTGAIARGEELSDEPAPRGAPEFGVLRTGMRTMAAQIEAGRARALEAERLRAFRESSRRFAHELKNPLTPIRFALTRLRKDAPVEQRDAIDVLTTETERLEAMARSFSQFGRLPEGPIADVDIAEMVTYTARSIVPDRLALTLDLAPSLPAIRGQHDALSRALSNILLNAVEVSAPGGAITVSANATELRGSGAVKVVVRDSGPGIPNEKLEAIWDPYVTEKPGGTGLGLAIVRQTIEAHGGEVFAMSTPGKTEIGFVLPLNAGLPAITGEWRAS